ncbi:MAG: AraC family ligand binding domain-containing protein [Desulfovibrio sp.]|uniref:cupin domain-containing protein n=1 Tax=Desulfovibrio sp. TaxID=885 RepID=UPI0039E21BE7
MEKDLFHEFETGMLAESGEQVDLGLCPWNEHKDFAGVSLKTIVTTAQTADLFTCHLVRIKPNHKIGMHTHPNSIEVHEVIKGSGTCLTEKGEVHYAPGVMTIIPRDEQHEVSAGEEGLCLFAKFITVSA